VNIEIEVFAAPGCERCAARLGELRAAAVALIGAERLSWQEVDVLEELDHAVALGVVAMPAIAVNGELRFPALPTVDRFRAVLATLG